MLPREARVFRRLGDVAGREAPVAVPGVERAPATRRDPVDDAQHGAATLVRVTDLRDAAPHLILRLLLLYPRPPVAHPTARGVSRAGRVSGRRGANGRATPGGKSGHSIRRC